MTKAFFELGTQAPASEPLTARRIYTGEEIWKHSYAHTRDDSEAIGLLRSWLLDAPKNRFQADLASRLLPLEEDNHGVWSMFAAKWADNAYPCIEMGHKMAASLMCTSIPVDLMHDTCAPWPAFFVRVPGGMLPIAALSDASGTIEAKYIAYCHFLGKSHMFLANDGGLFFTVSGVGLMSLCNRLTCAPSDSDPLLRNATESMVRAVEMGGRLLVGACLSMDARNASAAGFSGRSGLRRQRGEPTTRTVVLKGSVKLDCREHVRDYMSGASRSSPKIQSLVRGHWKGQPHGPAGSLRKWIHIEPYWRGPEDAPIAVRSHVLGAS